MEDVQPNELRLSRKGSTTIPRVRTVYTPYKSPHGTESRKQAPKRYYNHYPRARNSGSHPANNTKGIHSKARPSVKAREPAQSDEPGPSRSSHTLQAVVGRGGCSQRPDRRSSFPSSGYLAQRQPVDSPTAEVRSCQAQTVHTNPVLRHPPPIRAATPPGSIIDLTLVPPSPSSRDTFRWSTFRSGQVDIHLPRPSIDPRVLPSNTHAGSQPSIQQELAHVINQRGNMSVAPDGGDVLRLARPIIHTDVTLPMRSLVDFRTRDFPSDQLRQLDALEAAPSSHSSDHSVVLEDDTRLLPNCSPSARGIFTCGKLPLPLGSYDRPRRVLRNEDSAYVVTAHGVIDQIDAAGVLQLDRRIQTPHLPLEESVDDACILSHQGDSIIILGHAREQGQLTVLHLGHSQASRHIGLHRGWNTAKRPGVSAVTTLMSPLKFASGGHDHRVHVWDIAHDLSGASAAELAIKHTSVVHSLLAVMDTSHKLISVGADRDVPIYDLSAERVARTLKMSSTPHHAHKTDSPSCTLFEVAHLETQFEVRDHRYLHQIVQRFGFITEERRGRYEKADTWSHFVACGDKNGILHVWDLRNVTTEVALQPCFNDPIVQVVNTGSRLLACSKRNELACVDFSLGR